MSDRGIGLGVLTWLAVGIISLPASGAESLPRDPAVEAFFQRYCLRCHDQGKAEGQFRLDTLPRDFSEVGLAQRWGEVVFRLNAAEMPPRDEPLPSAAELSGVVEWISTRIKEGEAARLAQRGPVAHYRLSREEYGHTVYDLLGVYFDVTMPGAFNDEPRWHGFERIGALLSLSPSHVERYFRAAEAVVGRAFPDKPIRSQSTRRAADDGTWREQGYAGPARWLVWPGHSLPLLRTTDPGLYRIRVGLSGLPSFKGRLPHLAVWHQGLRRALTGVDVRTTEAEPTTIEIETLLPEGNYTLLNQSPGMFSDTHTLSNTRFTFRSSTSTPQPRPSGYKFFDEQGNSIYPLLIIDWIEVEGPIELDSDRQKREGVFPSAGDDQAVVRRALGEFATRAWRRPVAEAELDRYLAIINAERTAGETFPVAYRAALVALLTSKNFYYLEEGNPRARRERVNAWELAARLSYLLWSSLPDDPLREAAASGKLIEPATLAEHLDRMVADPKANRFTQSFPRQWLQLHRVGQFPPDAELFPDYDAWLEASMVLESTLTFETAFRENLPLRELIDGDWTMLNPRLALHYGIPPLAETGFQKVRLPAGTHRGGLLTQAGILSLTSDGTRHRPVHRGVWISEAIFARTPPPPPPNVEPLEPTPSDQPKATIRQQLEAHATHATCAACHAKIDPLGLAFDNFDAIGRWRIEEQVSGGRGANPPVNASGQFPDGRPFKGPDDFKRLLADDVERMADAFIEQLATYALRRVMTVADQPALRAIAKASAVEGYRLRSILRHLVLSDLFQQR